MASSNYRQSMGSIASINVQQHDADDNKYAKREQQQVPDLSLRSLTSKDVAVMMRNPFQVYAVFLMGCSVGYYAFGGRLEQATKSDLLGYISVIAEGLGLVALRYKIMNQGRVSGVSGMTIAMYCIVYILREVMLMPRSFSIFNLDGWMIEVLQLPAILMALDVLKSVFVTHNNSYQADLDVLNIKYLVPGCLLLAVLLHPTFAQGALYSYFWTAYLYLDIMALLPQVVMMAKAGGKIEAPIAHFVAALAFSRLVDLEYWYFEFELGPQGYWGAFNYSGWLIVVVHVLSLLLVADFMYYYLKARCSGASLSEDLVLPADDMMV